MSHKANDIVNDARLDRCYEVFTLTKAELDWRTEHCLKSDGVVEPSTKNVVMPINNDEDYWRDRELSAELNDD